MDLTNPSTPLTTSDDVQPAYENEYYKIVVVRNPEYPIKSGDNYYDSWYEVINKANNVCEGKTIIYPEALYVTEAYSKSLRKEEWRPEDERPQSSKLSVVKKLN